MIKCPNCSAELKYDVSSESVTCEYCGSRFNPKELEVKVEYSEEHIDSNSFSGKSYCCQDCGATLLTFDETAITFCSYCGSQSMIESKMIQVNNPDYIIPFKKTKEECINNYKKKIKNSFFAPNYMKQDIVVSKFRGIYIPYGIYYLSYNGNFSNTGSKRSHRSGDYVYYNDYSIVANTDTYYDGMSFDLLSKFYDKYSFSIPFNFKELESFNPNYLSGFYADVKDVDNETYDLVAKDVAKEDAKNQLKKIRDFRKYGCSDPKMPMNVSDRKIGMFPIYFLAIRDKKQEHVNYAVINGQTGRVAAGLPIDFKKYIFASAIISIILYLLISNIDYLLLPRKIVIFSIIASIISFIVSNVQLKRADINRKHLDDLGYITANKKNEYFEVNRIRKDIFSKVLISTFFIVLIVIISILLYKISYDPSPNAFTLILIFWLFAIVTIIVLFKNILKNILLNITTYDGKSKELMPFKIRVAKYLYKQIIAVVIGVLVLIFKPVHDAYYYGASIISFIMIIISFYDLVKEHNELVSNILSQLEKRGGDEHE